MLVGISRLFLKLTGWEPEGDRPTPPKFVLIAAPHTSNWDFPYLIALSAVYGVRLRWVGKHTLFRFPFGWLMRALGGISVDRRRSGNMVSRMAEIVREADEIALAVPAEGTRSRVEHWKSGFYHVAREAGVPIVLGFLDFKRRRGGFGPAIVPTGDLRADMDRIRAFYADKIGKNPERFGPVRLKEEEAGRAD